MTTNEWIWRDGEYLAAPQATVHISTHGLHYATAVFEGIRAYNGSVFLLRQHLERLHQSTMGAKLGVLPYTVAQLSEVVLELLRRNGMTDGYIRPIVFQGQSGDVPSSLGVNRERGLSVAIMTRPWPNYLSGGKARVCTDRNYLKPAKFPKPWVKSATNYGNAIQALREFLREDDQELIFCYEDPDSKEILVAEGSGCNIFLLHNGALITPRGGILPGLTRRTVFDIVESGEIDPNLEVHEEDIRPELLMEAAEIFVCGTAYEISPISALAFGTSDEYKPVGKGTPGPVTTALRDHFNRIAHGELDQWRYLLTPQWPLS